MSLIAHNIRSLWNIGSLFRSADVFGVEHLYLTGYTACPPRKEISKTAIGAEAWIPWSSHIDPLEAVREARRLGATIIALEKTTSSVALSSIQKSEDVCLIVGHEILGVPDELQQAADIVAHIPMHGRKSSLNVAIAASIGLHHFRNCCENGEKSVDSH